MFICQIFLHYKTMICYTYSTLSAGGILMKDFKQSKTYKNLEELFAKESMAHLRYCLYEEAAIEEGYEKAAEFFAKAKLEEKGRATLWFKLMNGGELPNTRINIKNQIEAENQEWLESENSYQIMLQVAKQESYEDIAKHFSQVAREEECHKDSLNNIIKNIKQ